MILSMETIIRSVSDENILDTWLELGVADNDIPYGTYDPDVVPDCYVTENKEYSYYMDLFTRIMTHVRKNGGLYSDKVCSLTRYE